MITRQKNNFSKNLRKLFLDIYIKNVMPKFESSMLNYNRKHTHTHIHTNTHTNTHTLTHTHTHTCAHTHTQTHTQIHTHTHTHTHKQTHTRANIQTHTHIHKRTDRQGIYDSGGNCWRANCDNDCKAWWGHSHENPGFLLLIWHLRMRIVLSGGRSFSGGWKWRWRFNIWRSHCDRGRDDAEDDDVNQ